MISLTLPHIDFRVFITALTKVISLASSETPITVEVHLGSDLVYIESFQHMDRTGEYRIETEPNASLQIRELKPGRQNGWQVPLPLAYHWVAYIEKHLQYVFTPVHVP